MVRAVCALDKAAQAAQVAEARAAVEWDKASLKVLRAAWVELRKEATRERRLTWQREYARRKSMGDPERDAVRAEREASQARLEALHAAQQAALRAKIEADELRREAEAAAMAQRRAAALAEAQATATKIAGPVRVGRVAFVPPSRP
ncbi:MAG TPA: hypothetical protein VNZ85_15360 [Caulobacter sp.]|nr:hypothetical protein [Caulobacter sp.]